MSTEVNKSGGIVIEGLESIDLDEVNINDLVSCEDEKEPTLEEISLKGNKIDKDFMVDDNESFIPPDADDIKNMIEGEEKDIPKDKEKDTLYDSKGNPVEFRIEGEIFTQEIKLDDILIPPRSRKLEKIKVDDLEKSILQWGLIEPLHVIPLGEKFLLVHGLRRYYALKSLGFESVICLVDCTRPKATLRFLEVIDNNVKPYDFYEVMNFGEFIERKQKTFQNETIENILGLETGDYLKAKYILQRDQFGIINDIVSNKKTIKEGFKKLEKELDKLEKEMDIDGDMDDPNSYLDVIEEDENIQSTKDRKPLPNHVYAKIKARDKYVCQTCGLGIDSPEINSIFEVHHIIPVAKGGSDNEENLILLCSNCHKIVGAYIDGEFNPPKEKLVMYSNMILLGNIARKGLVAGYTPYQFYKDKHNAFWDM